MDRREFLGAAVAAGAVLATTPADAFKCFKKQKTKPKWKPHIDPASQQIVERFLEEMGSGKIHDFVLMWRYSEDDPYFFGEPENIMSGAIGDEDQTD